MTSTPARCDRIIQLIDECLADYEQSARAIPRDVRTVAHRRAAATAGRRPRNR